MKKTLGAPVLAATVLMTSSSLVGAQTISTKLKADPKGADTLRLGYFPVPLKLTMEKPAGIKKEPTYRTAPKYAVIQLGNGPKSQYVIALDEPKDADWKIYLDVNHNGDLTDDGDGAWSKKDSNAKTGRTMYGVSSYQLKASYGTPKRETGTADYGVNFYRFPDLEVLLMYRSGARSGELKVDGKTYKATLVENDADALYDKPIDDDGKPIKAGAGQRPVWLLLDDGTPPQPGKMTALRKMIDARAPFKLGEKVYEAKIAADGSALKLMPTKRAAFVPKEPERPALLAKGVTAPEFTADKWGGGALKLSDYRGKVVILDFWATWCGPCMRSMPHLEKVHNAVKGQDVVALAVCVSDTRKAYEEWVPENQSKFTFQFAFDPAERDPKKSISANLYKVSGIPTTYIIGKDGKVVDSIVGYSDGDTRLEEALKKLGVTIAE